MRGFGCGETELLGGEGIELAWRKRKQKKQRAFGAEEVFSFTEDWRRRNFPASKQAVRFTD